MTVSTFMSALSQGYNAQQIVTWLLNNKKHLSKAIKSAKSQGYTDDDILTYLTKGKYASHGARNEMLSGQTEQEKATRILNRGTDFKPLAKGLLTAGTIAAGAAGAIGAAGLARGLPLLSRAASKLSALSGALQTPGQTPSPSGQPGPTPMSNAPTSLQGTTQSLSPQASPQSQQASSQIQKPQTTPSLSPQQSISIIQQMEIGPKIESLKQAGNTPEAISAAVGISLTPVQRKWLDEQIKSGNAKPLTDMISDYLGQSTPQNQPQQSPTIPVSQQNPTPQPQNEAPQPLKQKDLVETEDGRIGEVEHTREKDSLINVDGKIEKVANDKIKALYDKFKDVHIDVSHVPESERSAPLYGIRTANENKNLLVEFFPRNSDVADDEYEYFRKDGTPIDESLLSMLHEGMSIPVTSGLEYSGFWDADKADSRGSTFSKELRSKAQDLEKVKAGKEINDPSKPYYFVKKRSVFRHGFEREARRKFGEKYSEFSKEKKRRGIK